MKWPFRRQQSEASVAVATSSNDAVLKQIEALLFPPLETHCTSDGIEYCIDRSVDTNLDAALIDLREGFVDEIVLKSIEDSVHALEKIRRLLGVEQQMISDPSMLVVAPPIK